MRSGSGISGIRNWPTEEKHTESVRKANSEISKSLRTGGASATGLGVTETPIRSVSEGVTMRDGVALRETQIDGGVPR